MNDKSKADHRCNVCGNTRSSFLFSESLLENLSLDIYQCDSCGLIYTHPQPSQDFLVQLYGPESYQSNTVSGKYCLSEETSSLDFDNVLKYLGEETSGKKLLDIGCGAGHFLGYSLDRGWDSYGLEPSSFVYQVASEKFHDRVKNGYSGERLYPEDSFDCVTLWYVLEHVPDPAAVIKDALSYLKKDGLLFIAVPNSRYILLRRLIAKVFHGKYGSIHAHEHLYQFSQETLRNIISSNGATPFKELQASPYYVSSVMVNFAKYFISIFTTLLFRVSGINYTGLMQVSRKN